MSWFDEAPFPSVGSGSVGSAPPIDYGYDTRARQAAILSQQTPMGRLAQGVGTGMEAYGAAEQAAGYMQYGAIRNAAAQFAAAQLRQQANNAQGSAQRKAQMIGLNADYVISSQRARAAGSGGGGSDPTVLNLMARTKSMAGFQQSVALYGGAERARELNMSAAAEEYSGRMEASMGRQTGLAGGVRALTTALQGGVSLYSKYNPMANGGGDTDFGQMAG